MNDNDIHTNNKPNHSHHIFESLSLLSALREEQLPHKLIHFFLFNFS